MKIININAIINSNGNDNIEEDNVLSSTLPNSTRKKKIFQKNFNSKPQKN